MKQKKLSRKIKTLIFWVTLVAHFFIFSQASAKVFVSDNVYEKTEQRWRNAVAALSFKSQSWVWSLGKKDVKHHNGSRDSILLVPDATKPDDLTLVVWFHGCSGFSSKTFKKRILPQIEKVVADGNSVAIAIPEMPWSINTSTRCGRQALVWRRPGELERYVKTLKTKLALWAMHTYNLPLVHVRIVFVGHSAGGSAIASAAVEGSLCRLNPENVVWSDSSYSNWLKRSWDGCLKDAENTTISILVRKWDIPYNRTRKFMRRILKLRKVKPELKYKIINRKDYTHTKIGHNALELADIFPPGC